MAAGENRFILELNEKEIVELLEELSNILEAFLIKHLFHYPAIISYPTRSRGIIVYYGDTVSQTCSQHVHC